MFKFAADKTIHLGAEKKFKQNTAKYLIGTYVFSKRNILSKSE